MADRALPKPAPRPAEYFGRLGYGVIAAVFGGLLLWSILAPIDGAVIASGQVVVESNRKLVQHLEGGVIEEILVREGQPVKEGELIARLQDTVHRANVAVLDGQLTELYARRARLYAERDGLADMPEAEGLEAILTLPLFAAKYAGQKQLFEARRETRLTQISLLEERIEQQRQRISGLRAQVTSLAAQRRLINDELEGVRELNREGYAPMTRVRALERESERLHGDRGARQAAVAEAESLIAEAQLEIARLKETAREEAISQLRDTEVGIAEREERRIAAAEALERTEIRSPQAGRVLGLSIHTIGGVIAPGDAIMQIIPEGDKLEIAARVSPNDIEKVSPGQTTLVRFSSFGARSTPEAMGVVKTVSADSLADQITGAPYFLVLVELPDQAGLAETLKGRAIAPGMPAETFIRTGSRPAISYILKPLTDSFARSLRED